MKDLVEKIITHCWSYIDQVYSKINPRKHRFMGHYVEWRKKRISAIVDYYGADFFKEKEVLELGCGHGDIGSEFVKLGADVTCSDGRNDHLKIVKKKYPFIKTVLADLDGEWAFNKKFDLILHLGVLYHLKNYESSIRRACASTDYLVLESEVCDSTDPSKVIYTHENNYDYYDQALNETGCRPSPANIERILTECNMCYERLTDSRCNWDCHRYDWPIMNTGKWKNGMRALWFVCRKGTRKNLN